jgi:hypothetical protein
MLNRDNIKKGDILCYRGHGWIGKMGGGYEHVSLVSDVIRCDGHVVAKIIEAHLDTTDDEGNKVSGIFEKTLNIKWDEIIDVMRSNKPISEQAFDMAIARTRAELVGKKKYAWYAFPRVWFWSTFLKPLGLGNIKPLFKMAHSEVCSTWIQDEFFNQYLGIDLFPDLDNTVGIPSDYPKSPLLHLEV